MSDVAVSQSKTISLGAFDYMPASMSRIIGLGGGVIDPNPTYAFHTKYVDVGSGIVRCTLRFHDLQAEIGAITLSIHGLAPSPGAQAESVRVWTAQLRDIAEGEGVVELSFQSSAGSRYAALGQIHGESDARAKGLDVTFEVTADSDNPVDKLAASRKSIFGRRVFRRANRILAEGAPTLADPVCQACTTPQFAEPAYRRWIGEMQVPFEQTRQQWERVFVLQALARYGMLRSGARGLGFGAGSERLPAVMAAHGCEIVATNIGSGIPEARAVAAVSVEDFRYREICADDIFDRQVAFRPAKENKESKADKDLIGFDFTWSTRVLENLGTIADGAEFIRNSISCLTYGGLAVHTVAFDIASTEPGIDDDATVLFRKLDLERIAVDLISRGHYVAQFKYRADDKPVVAAGDAIEPDGYVATSFGIIARRGDR